MLVAAFTYPNLFPSNDANLFVIPPYRVDFCPLRPTADLPDPFENRRVIESQSPGAHVPYH